MGPTPILEMARAYGVCFRLWLLIYSHIKSKSVKFPFITKNSKHLVRTIFSDMKNKSVKLPFVTKKGKHLVGTGANDLLALIEFTPL